MPCLAPLLVQPQRLPRAAGGISALDDLANDLLRLVSRLTVNGMNGGNLVRLLAEAFEDSAVRCWTHAGDGLKRAETRLQAWLKSLVDGARSIELPDGADGAADLLQQALEKLAAIAGTLDADTLRPHAELLIDVVEHDLGLSPEFVTAEVWAIVDGVMERLEHVPDDLDDEARATWVEMRATLRRIKRRLQPEFTFPGFPLDRVVADLLALLRRSGIEQVAARAACLGRELAKGVRGAGRLVTLVPPSGFAVGTVGAAAAAPSVKAGYCWYATWLLLTKKRPDWWEFGRLGEIVKESFKEEFSEHRWYMYWLAFFESFGDVFGELGRTDEVWVEADRKRILWGEHVLMRGSDLTWQKALEYRAYDPRGVRKCADRVKPCGPGVEERVLHTMYGYTFGEKLTADFMEGWTRHTAWIRDYSVGLLHLMPEISLRQGDYAANLANAGVLGFQGSWKLGSHAPLDWWMDQVGGMSSGWWDWTLGKLDLYATLLGSLEGMHTRVSFKNWCAFQLTQTLSDGIKTMTYRSYADAVRDASICFFTLLNYEGERAIEAPLSASTMPYWTAEVEDDRPDNRKEIGGIADLATTLGLFLLCKAVPRDKYSFPFNDGGDTAELIFLWQFLGGAGVAVVAGFAGATVAEIIAWAEDWRLLGRHILRAYWSIVKNFWLVLYATKEGDTDEGRYNPVGPEYRGYPDASTSPYWLPWKKGDAWVCGQGNQGMWSHNAKGGIPEQYAYDFGLDGREPVLAARHGTIVDFFDWVPDDTDPDNAVSAPAGAGLVAGQTTSSKNNFILIRHDRDECGNLVAAPPGSDHDRGEGGATVWTYGQYLHGRTGSVRATFGNAAPTAIIGQPVTRGQQIMLAGDTGKSFHNHLHFQVRAGPAPRARANFAGDGMTTSFAYARQIAAATDLVVVVNNVTQVLNVAYTVSGVGSATGGTVDFAVAPAAGATILILLGVRLVGDGATTTFGYPFQVQLATDLVVLVGGVRATLNVDYTVTGIGNPAGGTVVFTNPPPAGTNLVIGVGAGIATPVSRNSLVVNTIPLVFREVSNPFAPDGVPQARTYYTSDNPGVTCP
jgi:hypothetical protein